MRWTAQMQGHEVVATAEQLDAFRRTYVTGELGSRIADLLIFDLYVLDFEFGISPHDIFETIKNLEAGEPSSGIKPATQFKHPPLQGLWHKHFFSAHFVAHNIQQGLGRGGLEKIVSDVLASSQPTITEEMIKELAHRATNEPIETRHAEDKLTGEWIVYTKHNGENYYLALNTHNAGDQFVYDRIIEHCIRNFPDLQEWLTTTNNAG